MTVCVFAWARVCTEENRFCWRGREQNYRTFSFDISSVCFGSSLIRAWVTSSYVRVRDELHSLPLRWNDESAFPDAWQRPSFCRKELHLFKGHFISVWNGEGAVFRDKVPEIKLSSISAFSSTTKSQRHVLLLYIFLQHRMKEMRISPFSLTLLGLFLFMAAIIHSPLARWAIFSDSMLSLPSD